MKTAVVATLCMLCAPALAFAHSGGLDSNGCHTNTAKKVYECHKGALEGQSFKSKAEAESRLSAQGGAASKPAQQSTKAPEAKEKQSKQSAKVPEATGKQPQQSAKVPEDSGKSGAGTTAPPKR